METVWLSVFTVWYGILISTNIDRSVCTTVSVCTDGMADTCDVWIYVITVSQAKGHGCSVELMIHAASSFSVYATHKTEHEVFLDKATWLGWTLLLHWNKKRSFCNIFQLRRYNSCCYTVMPLKTFIISIYQKKLDLLYKGEKLIDEVCDLKI